MTGLADDLRNLLNERREEPRVRVKNRLTDRVQDEFLALRATEEGRRALVHLLQDESESVRLGVGLRVLSFAPQSARPTLEALALRQDLVGLEATHILRQYDEGTLDLDWRPSESTAAPSILVDEAALDKTLSIHGAVMNGGFALAWTMGQDDFGVAEQTLRAVGRQDAARLLSAAGKALSDTNDATAVTRASRLSERYFALPDVQNSLEGAGPPVQ